MKKWILIIILVLVVILVVYFAHKKGFETGRDYTAQMDSTEVKKWVNEKWGYEITFPRQWDSIKRNDPSIKGMGADVFCSSKSGASTAVFISPVWPNYTIDSATDEVLNGYKPLGKITLIDKKDYIKDDFKYRTIIFRQGRHTQYYTIILTKKIMLTVSSNCPSRAFENSKEDFESILDSIKFF